MCKHVKQSWISKGVLEFYHLLFHRTSLHIKEIDKVINLSIPIDFIYRIDHLFFIVFVLIQQMALYRRNGPIKMSGFCR